MDHCVVKKPVEIICPDLLGTCLLLIFGRSLCILDVSPLSLPYIVKILIAQIAAENQSQAAWEGRFMVSQSPDIRTCVYPVNLCVPQSTFHC